MRGPGLARARPILAAAFIATLLAAGCGEEDGPGPTPPQSLSVVITPDAFTIPWIGASLQVLVTLTTSTEPEDITASPTTSYASPNTSVAGVTPTGEVVANGLGTTTIVVSSSGFSDTSAVTVDTLTSIATSTVVLTAPTLNLTAPSPTVQTTAEIGWSNGARLRGARGYPVTYSSSDTTVARVDENGLVTAVADGQAQIAALHGGQSAQISISVALTPPISFQSEVLPLFTNGVSRCIDATCHPGTGTPQRNLRMSTYADIVSGTSENGPIVIPGDGAGSLLVRVLRGAVEEIGSARMPRGRTALPRAAIDKVERWIDEGAIDN